MCTTASSSRRLAAAWKPGWTHDGQARITVEDNGCGISAAFLPHVFERFRQQDSSSTRESFGLGLGLSIVKHMVELHGGSIRAYSSGNGLGATFIVHLPVGRAWEDSLTATLVEGKDATTAVDP